MKYGDDQCERCGGVRVAKSTLCADCLVKLFNKAVWQVVAQEKEIKRLTREIVTLRKLLEDATEYGFEKNQENALLLRSHKRLEDQLEEAMKNGKDRETEDTGL